MNEVVPFKPLGSVGVAVLDCEHKTPAAQESGYPYIAIPDIVNGRVDIRNARRISDTDFAAWTRRTRPQGGDVVVTRRGRVGDSAPIPDGLACAIGQNLVLLRSDGSHIDQRFLRWATRAPSWRSEVERMMNVGAVFSSLNVKDVPKLRVPVPPIPQQSAIADVLCALEDKIETNEHVARNAFALANTMALDLMRSTGIVLCSMKFGDLGELFDGPHATPTRRAEGPYFLNISSLKSGRLDLSESDHVSESDFLKWTRRVTPQPGDLLFSYETRLGEAALMPEGVRACLGRRMALLRPDRNRVDPHFLLHFYLSPTFQRIIAARTIHGATVPRIGLASMGDWEIEVPPMHEQEVIAGSLRSLHEAMVEAERESVRLATVRDELLPLLISGKVQVKDVEPVVPEVL
ncbi:restriction endonuclease subunit S [Mycobacterium sp. E342]|uniref:restriction endonuclease subunit S n=1 Tax=Mycobacterium sp. E342 TaxID=1834147 RepID=UPI0009ED5DFA|nr:restriction endonuclease subunit S [Mycobacterium sp. E342]